LKIKDKKMKKLVFIIFMLFLNCLCAQKYVVFKHKGHSRLTVFPIVFSSEDFDDAFVSKYLKINERFNTTKKYIRKINLNNADLFEFTTLLKVELGNFYNNYYIDTIPFDYKTGSFDILFIEDDRLVEKHQINNPKIVIELLSFLIFYYQEINQNTNIISEIELIKERCFPSIDFFILPTSNYYMTDFVKKEDLVKINKCGCGIKVPDFDDLINFDTISIYKNSKIDYDNDTVSYQYEVKSCMGDGVLKVYYKSGQLKREIKLLGINRKELDTLYLPDNINHPKKFEIVPFYIPEDHLEYISYFKNGKIKSKIKYNGIMVAGIRGRIIEEEIHGDHIVYYENGLIKRKINYLNGEKVDYRYEYDETGNLISSFNHGKFEGRIFHKDDVKE
jgi:antitoxin component YwqK of YwqJK toxin-antitoxin module